LNNGSEKRYKLLPLIPTNGKKKHIENTENGRNIWFAKKECGKIFKIKKYLDIKKNAF
jgi:hypothetical protein